MIIIPILFLAQGIIFDDMPAVTDRENQGV
jgi:hypothetical protein